MKKAISTILALVMLATPLVGTACFADEPADNVGDYVQSQDRSERFKFDKKTVVKAGKIASCIAAGTAAVVGATVAGLKIFEDDLPESIKEYLPFLFKKANKAGGKLETIASSEEVSETVASSTGESETVAPFSGRTI